MHIVNTRLKNPRPNHKAAFIVQHTYQDRLTLNLAQARWMNAFGELYGRLQRTLYARVAKGEKAIDLKSAFCAEHGLSARQFNALRMELDGKISGTVELLKLRKKELARSIRALTRSVAKLERQIDGQNKLLQRAKDKGITFCLKQRTTWQRQCFGKKRGLVTLQSKFKQIEQRLKGDAPGICFGSRKLFRQQFHLELTEFGSGDAGHAAWRRAWLDARSHQFFLVGSKDETAGNQSCKARVVHAAPTTGIAGPSTLTLTIKMPQALVQKRAPAFITVEGVRFDYGHEDVIEALKAGTALSYRFHRDDHSAAGWRVFISTDTPDAERKSLPRTMGVLGVDFNADHLAWAHTDRFGNAVQAGRIDLVLSGKTSDQRDALLSAALDRVFALARQYGCAVAIEDLDFAAKKRELQKMGVRYARMLSGLTYARYKQLAQSKAARLGLELLVVDPAYTSVAGSVKYAVRLGRTVHQAAAGVIARRAQGYSEKLPKSEAQGCTFRAPLMGDLAVLTLPVESGKSTQVSWASIRKCLTRHCAEQARLRHKKKSSKPQDSTQEFVNSRQLAGGVQTPPAREPVTLLDRRNIQPGFPDVPF